MIPRRIVRSIADRLRAGRDARRSATRRAQPHVDVEYAPRLDGDADPGEVVWTWVPYEDDPTQGKDRPVVVIARDGSHLVVVPLTSRHRDDEPQVSVGVGSWDHEGRPSWARVDRVVDVPAAHVRREGAILARDRFDAVVTGVRRARSGS